MGYQRVSKPSSGNSQIHKKESPSSVPAMPVQAKSDSALAQDQEMPNYIPLAANWATNNNLMRSLSGTQEIQRQEELGKEEMEPIQAKLTIGQVGDKYEQEADQTAQRVVSQINSPQGQALQREEKPEEEELQKKPMVQRKSAGGGMDVTPNLEASIQQAKGSGQPLSENIRQPMEQAFGADFSGVNVHTDAQSDQLNQSIQAKAFTTGQDVFFRQGAYDPSSRGGQELIAHELTHVVQQSGGAVQRAIFKSPQQSLATAINGGRSETIQRQITDAHGQTMTFPQVMTYLNQPQMMPEEFKKITSNIILQRMLQIVIDSPDSLTITQVQSMKKEAQGLAFIGRDTVDASKLK